MEFFLNPGLIPSQRDQMHKKFLHMLTKNMFKNIKVFCHAYIRHISGISQAYLLNISDISQTYLRHIKATQQHTVLNVQQCPRRRTYCPTTGHQTLFLI